MTAHSFRMPSIPLGIRQFAAPALCAQKGVDDSLWFPDQRTPGDTKAAKRICAQCPARAECLESALRIGADCIGIWGGTTEPQRRRLRSQRKRVESAVAEFGPQLEGGAR